MKAELKNNLVKIAVMKSKPSLNNRLLAYIAGFASILLISYTFLTVYYLMSGLDYAMKFALEGKANHYQKQYFVSSDAALPKGVDLFSYRQVSDIPSPLLELFPVEELEHNELKSYFEQEKNIVESHPAARMPSLCDGTTCEMIFFYSYKLEENEWLYLVIAKSPSELFISHDAELHKMLYISVSIGLVFLILILVFAYILLRKVAQPINCLTDWADKVTVSNLLDPLPDLAYRELDSLACQLQSSLLRVEETLEHERKFLANASHELRTPIAVQQANITLLKKLGYWQDDGSEESKAQERILRASMNMRQLTDTLLWLSRDFQTLPESNLIALTDLTQKLVEENRYLLKHKPVDVEVEGGNVGYRYQKT